MDVLLNNFLPEAEWSAVTRLCQRVRGIGGRAFVVGGVVRDALLGQSSKDADVEVFGVPVEQLRRLLASDFRFSEVGRAFGVFKLHGLEVDVSVPRRESKAGIGHKGFVVESEPDLSLEEAAARRDFTINAVYCDPLEGTIVDPHGGQTDLQKRTLRHVSDAFDEDPLRVLRAMQFSARFMMRVAPETVHRCRAMTPEDLPRERFFEEWRKLVVLGTQPSRGLEFLRECGWIRYFPELEALVGCEQDPHWHPEGDVWNHTLHSMNAFAERRVGDAWEDLVVGLAVLCHDMGKPVTTAFFDGRIRSHRHDIEGETPTRSFLQRITQHKALTEQVVALVLAHMRPAQLAATNAGDMAVRRLALKVGRLDRLARVVEADMWGRPPEQPLSPGPADWLRSRAKALEIANQKPRPILQGRHLIDRGLQPGPRFKAILADAFDAQVEGSFDDLTGALEWLDEYLSNSHAPRDA